jgi:hypothetical protein
MQLSRRVTSEWLPESTHRPSGIEAFAAQAGRKDGSLATVTDFGSGPHGLTLALPITQELTAIIAGPDSFP